MEINRTNIMNVIRDYNLKADKDYGQNFLIDPVLSKRIVDSLDIKEDEKVLEIGPGLGSLTEYLQPEAKKLVCYEIDDDMISILHERFDGLDNLTVLKQDFMEVDINKDIDKYFDGDCPENVRDKILCYEILWDYLWAQWTVIKEAKGDDFGTYGYDRFSRAISNLQKLKSY
jgi:SAM-dependent methyltransferase